MNIIKGSSWILNLWLVMWISFDIYVDLDEIVTFRQMILLRVALSWKLWSLICPLVATFLSSLTRFFNQLYDFP